MTALTDLELWYFADDIRETLAHLTSAKITVGYPTTCHPLQRLTNLRELVMQSSNNTVDTRAISVLTNLTALSLVLKVDLTDNLTHLTNLKCLVVDTRSNLTLPTMDFRKLPNLERLGAPILNTDTFNSLMDSTNLTALEIGLNEAPEGEIPFYGLLEGLPLRRFINVLTANNSAELWRALGHVPTLQEISAIQLENDENVLHLTGLSNLTKLSIRNSRTMTGQHLTALTSLQVLEFNSLKSIFALSEVFGQINVNARSAIANLEKNLPYLYDRFLY